MKIAIIQFTDIHIQTETDFILKRKDEIIKSIVPNIDGALKVFVVLSGDIVNKGSKSEFDIAFEFLKNIEEQIRDKCKFINSYNYVLVPGNHDCDFSNKDVIREALLAQTLNKDIIDGEILEKCMSVQKNFWDFYHRLTGKEEKFISLKKQYPLNVEKDLVFYCYNTSWCSSIKEKVGDLIIPSNKFLEFESPDKLSINISVFHHPTNWLSPNTDSNNKKSFEALLLKKSNLVLSGHEHTGASKKTKSLNSKDGFIYIEGKALQNLHDNNSGFNLFVIDTKDNNIINYDYEWNKDIYHPVNILSYKVFDKKTGLIVNDFFLEKINKLSIPIKHPEKSDLLNLSDVFVYPDLEPITENEENLKYINSENILDDLKSTNIIIEGESQSGKSSLINKLYSEYYASGYYPIKLEGKKIKSIDTVGLIKKAIKSQYFEGRLNFTKYNQLDKERKIILIDDFDKSNLNSEFKEKLIDKLQPYFGSIIITAKESVKVHQITEVEKVFSDFEHYKILPLGYYKRNKLIEKWIRIGKNELTLKEEEVLRKVKITFDTITNLLGEQLIPSYPFFILTLLQSLDNQLKSYDIAPTSYAYCYHSLIHVSLLRQQVKNDKIGSVFNFLIELSFKLYDEYKSKSLSEDQFKLFYKEYTDKFIFSYGLDEIQDILCNAVILNKEDNHFYFSYKYLSYYLTAKKISTILNEEKGKNILSDLSENLNIEMNANILVFLTHHTKDNNLLEELLFRSMLPFENYKAITLDLDDTFFSFLSNFVSTIKDNILPENTNPKANRENELVKRDQKEFKRKNNTNDNNIENDDLNFNENNESIDIIETFKVIKILGQIIKNQHGNFEKDKLISLLEASYNACFRSIDFLTTVIKASEEEITELIFNKFSKKQQENFSLADREKIKNKIINFLQFLGYRLCLASFSNLSLSVGTSNMNDIYDKVADKIGSPAAKLITFNIKTYYGQLSIPELKKINEEFKNNHVAMHLLKSRVYSYVYNNYVDFKKRDQILSILDLKSLPITTKS